MHRTHTTHRSKLIRTVIPALVAITTLGSVGTAAQAQSAAVAQQIIVAPGGTPYTGTADLRLALFRASSGGVAVSPVINLTNVQVVNGICAAPVNFGTTSAIDGQPLWMLVRARTPAGSANAFVTLPRQPLVTAATAQRGLGGQLTGSQGPVGPTGATGPAGPVGPVGSRGPFGPTGPQGPQGPSGASGTPGVVGPAGATGFTGVQGRDAAPLNPLWVGAKRWYAANIYGADPAPGFSFSSAMVFDGQYMWTTSFQQANPPTPQTARVTRTDPKTLARVSTLINGYTSFTSACVAGKNLWLAAGTSLVPFDRGTLTAGTPATISFTPSEMIFDGTRLWGISSGGNVAARFNASTGATIGSTTISAPTGIAFDGRWIWVSESNTGNLVRIEPSNGAVMARVLVGGRPGALAFDGTHMWATDSNTGGNRLFRVNVSNDVPAETITLPFVASKLQFDGANMWAVAAPSATFTPSKIISTRTLGFVGEFSPGSIVVATAFDGVYLWFLDVLAPQIARN